MAVNQTRSRRFRLHSPITRQSINISPKQHSREKRFVHRNDSTESGLKTYDQPSCGSIHILRWLYEHKIDFKDLMKSLRTTKFVLRRAVVGIQAEGKTRDQISEANRICEDLTSLLKNHQTTTSDIGERCAYLYTRDGFLFRRVSQVLRGKCFITSHHLVPYCALLSAYLQKRCFEDGKFSSLTSPHTLIDDRVKLLYRGIKLSEEMIEEYRRKLGQRISWPAFSSTTKNRAVAEMYKTNAIFIIDATVITSISTDYLADIGKFSHFPDEEEILLAAGINLVIGKVSQNPDEKYEILLYVSENYVKQIPKRASERNEDLHFRKNKKWNNTWMENPVGPVNTTFFKGLLAPHTIPYHKSEPIKRVD